VIENPEDVEKITDLLHNLDSAINRHIDQILLEQLGVGLSQIRILRILQTTTAAQRDLADSLNQTEPAISRQIKLLAGKGLVQASVDDAEKRRNVISLTVPGIKVIAAANELLSSENQKILSQLTRKQQIVLTELLQKIKIS